MLSQSDDTEYNGPERPAMKCLRKKHKIRDLIQREKHCLADPNYLSLKQKNKITPQMRSITLDWIFEVIFTKIRVIMQND